MFNIVECQPIAFTDGRRHILERSFGRFRAKQPLFVPQSDAGRELCDEMCCFFVGKVGITRGLQGELQSVNGTAALGKKHQGIVDVFI